MRKLSKIISYCWPKRKPTYPDPLLPRDIDFLNKVVWDIYKDTELLNYASEYKHPFIYYFGWDNYLTDGYPRTEQIINILEGIRANTYREKNVYRAFCDYIGDTYGVSKEKEIGYVVDDYLSRLKILHDDSLPF